MDPTLPYDHNSINSFCDGFLVVYIVMEPLTFLFLFSDICSLRNNKISADGVLVLAGALIVNRNLKLE